MEVQQQDKIEDILSTAQALRWEIGENFHEKMLEAAYAQAASIADRVVSRPYDKKRFDVDRTIDRLVTSRIWGFPLMILLFTFILWITISGANVPSELLSQLLLGIIYPFLKSSALGIGLPSWISGLLIDGIYLTTAWVVSVMLPPMAIFFPLFTLLEDLGYLPRLAFNLDNIFRKVGAHGRQALTMMMGYGCNAAAMVSTRIIESPRERLIAMITNNFAICNGRWPLQFLLASLFIGSLFPAPLAGFISAIAVVSVALLGILLSFIVSYALSRTVLRGTISTFSLELPPYRPPRILQTIYTSLIDRTIYVLWRAVTFAAPAGAVIWLIANIKINNISLAEYLVNFLNPLGVLIGLNGIILVAYIVAIPANEIVIPTILMLTVLITGRTEFGAGAGVLFETDSELATMEIFKTGGWTLLTAINLMIFSLIHNPCSTTIYTMYKESGSKKWTAVATLLPLILGFIVTFFIAQFWRLITGT